jgi:predicted dehydrogenase
MMKQYGMAVIGLGVVGRRMIEQTARHGGFTVVAAFDSAPAARGAVAAGFPDVPICATAMAAIERLDVDVVYVAVPPLAHAQVVRSAIAAGKAVFCEKPLGIDVAESVALTAEIAASGAPSAVNFVFASSAAVDALQQAIGRKGFDLRAVEVQTRFHEWPRAWQAGAAWLKRADQGGFTREVLSHYVYLLHRLFGSVELRGAVLRAPTPGLAETSVAALLDCGGVPVTMTGSVGGQPPDVVEARFIGARRELKLVDWFRLIECSADAPLGVPVPGLPDDPRAAVFQAQLTQLHEILSARAHTLPTFSVALDVQRIVEAMLAERTTQDSNEQNGLKR